MILLVIIGLLAAAFGAYEIRKVRRDARAQALGASVDRYRRDAWRNHDYRASRGGRPT